MTLTAFLDSNNIKWFPINLEVNPEEKKSKNLLPIKHNFYGYGMPTTNDFNNLTDREIKNRQTLADKYNYIAIDTTDIQHIDVDNPETKFSLKDQGPYYLSVTKKLPHFFVKVNRAETFKYREGWVDDPKIELLNGQWAFAKKYTEVINPVGDVPSLEWKSWKKQESVKPKSPVSVKPKSPVEDFINMAIVKLEKKNDYSEQIPGLTELGFTNIKFKNDGYNFDCDQIGKACPLCDGQHTSNHYFLFQKGGLFFVKNHSDGCKETKLPCSEIEEIFEGFKNGRASHELFAKLFEVGFRNQLAFSGGYWYRLNEGGIFRKLEKDAEVVIGIDMKRFCTKRLLDLVKETTDDDKRKHLYQALAQFENYKFKMNCISASREAFHQPNLADELDQNMYLLGFENGVYDLQADEFRKATIDDKISLSVGYVYYGDKNTDIQVFENLIDGYFSSPEKARWFKKHLGSLICGGNSEEKAYFWTGYGRNGKGTIEMLLSGALGEYFKTVKRELYTERGKKSGAEPEMLQLRNARVGMTAETDGDQKFISSIFKGMTGNDKISARTLYSSKVVEFTSSHKTIIQTNHLPQFTEVSVGLLQRVIAIVFDYQFLDRDTFNPSNPEHKRGDHQLKEKLEKHREGFIHFLIKWFKVYKLEKLDDVPAEIQESNKEYRGEIDTVGSFVKMALIQTGDEKHVIKNEDLRARYNAWATMNHLGDVMFGKRLRAVGIVPKRQGKDKRNAITGYVFQREYEEEFQEANKHGGGFGADY